MIWKGFGRKRLWLNAGTTTDFAWRGEENHEKYQSG
jgi:hypothetical protein